MPDAEGCDARLILSHSIDPSVISVDALPAASGFDLETVAEFAIIAANEDGHEHLALSDGRRHLRIDIAHGYVLHGPVAFKLLCKNPAITPIATENLKRASQVWMQHRMAATWFPKDRRLKRNVLALRVYDAICDNASYQDIARVLYGDDRVDHEWNAASDSMRSTIRRIARHARQFAKGGYHDILLR